MKKIPGANALHEMLSWSRSRSSPRDMSSLCIGIILPRLCVYVILFVHSWKAPVTSMGAAWMALRTSGSSSHTVSSLHQHLST